MFDGLHEQIERLRHGDKIKLLAWLKCRVKREEARRDMAERIDEAKPAQA